MKKKISKEAVTKLVRYALALVELDTPGKRSLYESECQNYEVDSVRFLKEIDATVRDYEFALGEKPPRGFHTVNKGEE